jgi:hypothetical protein
MSHAGADMASLIDASSIVLDRQIAASLRHLASSHAEARQCTGAASPAGIPVRSALAKTLVHPGKTGWGHNADGDGFGVF